jgi:hypothetical protein
MSNQMPDDGVPSGRIRQKHREPDIPGTDPYLPAYL